MKNDKLRYAEFLHSGPLKRVYVDIPEKAHILLQSLAKERGISMKAQLTLLIADAVEKKPRPSKPKRGKKKVAIKRGMKHGRKAKKAKK